MSTKVMTVVIIVLALVIAVLAWLLWVTPAVAPTHSTSSVHATSSGQSPATSTRETPTTSPQQPLHNRVIVDSPKAHATVGHTLTIKGSAPGPWFFEGQFPIKVVGEGVDADQLTLASAPARAEGEWTTDASVPFTATISIDPGYKGPATIVLLKDNPSGLPQNDDSLEVPIVVQ